MTRTLRYTAEATDNLAEIAVYIATSTGSRALAEGFVAQLRRKCATLSALPGMMGRPRPELLVDVRSVAYKGYVIFFRYRDDTMEIVAVVEGHRDISRLFDDDHF